MLKMTSDEVMGFLADVFPQIEDMDLRVERLEQGRARVRMPFQNRQLRPGGTISGPSLCALVDVTMYLLILARLGPVALAVTTNLNINFLRRPAAKTTIAEARMLKLGRRLAVGEVAVFSEGEDEMVAHATLTYSIPPAESGEPQVIEDPDYRDTAL
jgi:uncharacterized protein (TIGR00369 family)